MDKSIIFKAKILGGGDWKVGDLLHKIDCTGEYETLIHRGEDRGCCIEYPVDPKTVCQFVGITDRNENYIFTGDICKYYNPEDGDGIAIIRDDYAEWIGGTICRTEKMTPLFYLRCGDEWEIIGNIFDNPELIKKNETM